MKFKFNYQHEYKDILNGIKILRIVLATMGEDDEVSYEEYYSLNDKINLIILLLAFRKTNKEAKFKRSIRKAYEYTILQIYANIIEEGMLWLEKDPKRNLGLQSELTPKEYNDWIQKGEKYRMSLNDLPKESSNIPSCVQLIHMVNSRMYLLVSDMNRITLKTILDHATLNVVYYIFTLHDKFRKENKYYYKVLMHRLACRMEQKE